MIIFNHLLHKHLIDYSRELHSFGVLVGCLLSEGLCQTDSGRKYLSTRHQSNLHCDLFLAWNEKHSNELIREAFCTPPQNATCVGVPRFDAYKAPFQKIFENSAKLNSKIKILVNTTFAIAHFHERSNEEKMLLIGALGEGTEGSKNYERLIESHFKSRELVLGYLEKIIAEGSFELTIRPHPREEKDFYTKWINSKTKEDQRLVKISPNLSVASDILNHDVVLNCEDCTTALESWIAGKPTITLALSQDPAFFTDVWRKSSPVVESPDELIAQIRNATQKPDQPAYRTMRDEILRHLVYKADGQSSLRAAQAIVEVLKTQAERPRFPFDFHTLRRAAKLHLLRLLNQPAHATPRQVAMDLLKIGSHEKSSIRDRNYFKAVKPSDVRQARDSITKILNAN